MESPGLPSQTDFEDLARSPAFQQFAVSLRRLTGLPMALNATEVIDIRLPRCGGSSNPICRMIRRTSRGRERCNACDRRHHTKAASTGRSQLYTCHAGFLDMAVPVFVGPRHIATISCGQVLPEPHSDAAARRMRRRVQWLRIDEAVFRRAYRGAPYLPRQHLRDVMRLLEIFARHLCESAQRIRELEARLERDEIRAARAFVERAFRNADVSLSATADAAGLSPAHFSHVFHRATGETFTRFVQRRRVEEARRLLQSTPKDITSICFACGFNSLTHFNRVFRRFERCSPRQYRKRIE